MNRTLLEDGLRVSQLLAGCWRAQPPSAPPLSLDEVRRLEPRLQTLGCAAAAWRQLAAAPWRMDPRLAPLQHSFRVHCAESFAAEISLPEIVAALKGAGVEFVLAKGWSAAARYGEPGIRPYGDYDFFLNAAQLEAAQSAVSDLLLPECHELELHTEYNLPYDRPVSDFIHDSTVELLGDTEVPVPRVEDHIRFLALHLLYHGAWRPLGLCDIAAMVESAESEPDWERVFHGDPLFTSWVRHVIPLAIDCVGLDPHRVPEAVRSHPTPDWLRPAMLEQWGRGDGSSLHGGLGAALPHVWRKEGGLWAELRSHWRNPIEASVELSEPFDARPRAPIQFRAVLRRLRPGAPPAW